MINNLKLYLILLLFSAVADASSTLEKCKASVMPSILALLSDAPFSGKLPSGPNDILVPVVLSTKDQQTYPLLISWADISGFSKKMISDFTNESPFSYHKSASENILIKGVEFIRPDAREMKHLLDEFRFAAKLKVLRGVVWEGCFTILSFNEIIHSGRAYGEDYLMERESTQSVISLLSLAAFLISGQQLTMTLAQSTAVSVFSSVMVRRLPKEKNVAVFSFYNGSISYVVVLPILIASNYFLNNRPVLRWAALMMPYLLEKILSADLLKEGLR